MAEQWPDVTPASLEEIQEGARVARKVLDSLKEDGFELVVFDFDYTILKIHAFHERIRRKELVHKRDVIGDFADWPVFYSLIAQLSHEEEMLCGVASFGFEEVILEYMSISFAVQMEALLAAGADDSLLAPLDYFSSDNVVSSGEAWKEKVGKSKMLAELAGWFSEKVGRDVATRSSVVLFDDTKSNCEQVAKHRYEAVYVPVEGKCGPGMTRCFWETLLQPDSP